MHEPHLPTRGIPLHKGMPIGAAAHQAGTVRSGTDPADSALDVHGRAHGLDNPYVVGTSLFPSIGAVDPSLTAVADALRAGDHILERPGRPRAVSGADRARLSTGRRNARPPGVPPFVPGVCVALKPSKPRPGRPGHRS